MSRGRKKRNKSFGQIVAFSCAAELQSSQSCKNEINVLKTRSRSGRGTRITLPLKGAHGSWLCADFREKLSERNTLRIVFLHKQCGTLSLLEISSSNRCLRRKSTCKQKTCIKEDSLKCYSLRGGERRSIGNNYRERNLQCC